MKEKRQFDPGKIGRGFLIGVIGIFILSIVFGSFYNVSEQEQAVVTQFGKVVQTNSAGLYDPFHPESSQG